MPGLSGTPVSSRIFELDEADLFGSMSADPLGEEEAAAVVERRRVLESLVALGAVTAAQGDALSVVRNEFDASLAQRGHEHAAEDWQEVAWEYGHSYLVSPPQALMSEIAADVLALTAVIDRTDDVEKLAKFYGVGATLASIMAMTATQVGMLRESRDWWHSARHYADVSDDRNLRVWVQGHEAMDTLYQGRPFRLVLDRAEAAIRLSDGNTTTGTLKAMACKAQVLSVIGATDDARAAVGRLRRTFETLPDAVIADGGSLQTWPEHRLLHTESFVYSAIGPVKEAAQAHAAASAAYEPTRIRARAQVALHEAVTLVRGGDIDDGIGHAERTLANIPSDHSCRYVRVIAKRVLDAVPEAEAGRPVVAEYRERLAQPIAV
ncbi:hypothetical protein AGRA3207_002857 [Actinomadura graeca]|uniref:XRE family transcriptional regulator n=1 Tax=Actinomadura graeca TaxID=2750812 RepID=A0ABX8QSX9_9ACTN|nr:hypothetical protein [Actinomadura graeca]QXJ21940.1 hypothetical protein AGRA3207_002857 [Actinomadura graeca]